jgi:alpha-tubulin suppressor-like RCC1 family protein
MNLQQGFSSFNLGTAIAAEDTHLYVCGRNDNSQLGQGTNGNQFDFLPLSLPTTSSIKMLASGQSHSLALMEDGELFGWGYNADDQLGAGRSERVATIPERVPLPQKIIFVTVGAYHTICIQEDGTFLVFGQNSSGELGIGITTAPDSPTVLRLASRGVQASCGWNHTLFLTEDGTVYSSGRNLEGQLGVGDNRDRSSPQKVQFPKHLNISAVACGANYYSHALTSKGKVYSWGYNEEGCLGLGDLQHRSTPVRVRGIPEPVRALACGDRHTLALTANSTLYVWGWNSKGQLGLPDGSIIVNPTPLPIPSKILSVGCGYYHSAAFCCGGEIYVWGSNDHGALGVPGYEPRRTPLLLAPTSWKARRWGWQEKWDKAGRWIFLGRGSPKSEFSQLPVEVVYQFVVVLFQRNKYGW